MRLIIHRIESSLDIVVDGRYQPCAEELVSEVP